MTTTKDPWSFLRQFTHARIALGRAGHGTPTRELLNFRLAHSQARDSVWSEVDFHELKQGLAQFEQSFFEVRSGCETKESFLLNPDLGRELSRDSQKQLDTSKAKEFDTVLVIADGLSANAIHLNAWHFAEKFLTLAKQAGISLGPVILAKYARVGLGDAIGNALQSKSTVVLIGERPGLAASDSLSVYYTFRPKLENTDANRNCISNIHAAGLSPPGAAIMTEHLLKSSFQARLSGVDLKVEYPALAKK